MELTAVLSGRVPSSLQSVSGLRCLVESTNKEIADGATDKYIDRQSHPFRTLDPPRRRAGCLEHKYQVWRWGHQMWVQPNPKETGGGTYLNWTVTDPSSPPAVQPFQRW